MFWMDDCVCAISPSRGNRFPRSRRPVFQKDDAEKMGTGTSQDRYVRSRFGASPRFFTSNAKSNHPPLGTDHHVAQKSNSAIFEPPYAAVNVTARKGGNISCHPTEGSRLIASATPKTPESIPSRCPGATSGHVSHFAKRRPRSMIRPLSQLDTDFWRSWLCVKR